jgi:hypothetical protein
MPVPYGDPPLSPITTQERGGGGEKRDQWVRHFDGAHGGSACERHGCRARGTVLHVHGALCTGTQTVCTPTAASERSAERSVFSALLLVPVLHDERREQGRRPCVQTRTPYNLHPTSYTLHPTTYTPTPYILRPTPYTLRPTPHTLHPTPYILHPTPPILHRTPPLHPRTHTLHPAPHTLSMADGRPQTGLHPVRRTASSRWICATACGEGGVRMLCVGVGGRI